MSIRTVIYIITISLFIGFSIPVSASDNSATAIFAGGCFWCMEHPFEELDGVGSVVSGYTGGDKKDPTYEEVSSGTTGHIESIKITFDPGKVSYTKLLEVFWMQVDPTDSGGQFVDRGFQYTTAIFYTTDEQRSLAEDSKRELDKTGRFSKDIVTPILKAGEFFVAEDYHQDYYKEHPVRYKYYRYGSGRDKFLDKVWSGDEPKVKNDSGKFKKPSDEELKSRLTALHYKVTQKEGTERAFDNEFWDNKREGIYVDLVSGEPLFRSIDKFKSGTGWPSFTRPLDAANIVEKEDSRLFMVRIEVRSVDGDSHLGHLFNDGPAPTGQRYCINSAALRFVAKDELEVEGYGQYLKLFSE